MPPCRYPAAGVPDDGDGEGEGDGDGEVVRVVRMRVEVSKESKNPTFTMWGN